MPVENNKTLVVIDKLIYFFTIIFLCSITNSIFVNQIGYYFTLILIVVRFFLTKRNPFSKTGIEYAFVIYIVAEILSTVFSLDRAHSFINLLKRFFLLPMTYTFIVSASDFSRAKKYVIIYLGAAMATMIAYLALSYNYFINSFYQLYESGPATFQYPITSGELMSFSLIFLFTFLIFEKMLRKWQFLVLILFVINLLALIATYKRTGWLGAAAGILFVIVLGKKWKLLIPILLIFIAASLIEKNKSNITIYDFSQNNIRPVTELKTEGRAYNVFPEQNYFYVSDFENGLIKYRDGKIIAKYEMESPVIDFKKWRDNYYAANLIDTRFVLMNLGTSGKLKPAGEFITTGFTVDWCVANGFIYVIDSDSGLTVFRNPLNLNDRVRFSDQTKIERTKIFADSNYLVLFSKEKVLSIFSLKNYLPDKLIGSKKFSHSSELVFYKDSRFIFSDNDGLKLFSIISGSIRFEDINKNIINAFKAIKKENKLFVATTKKMLFELDTNINNKLTIKSTFNLGFVPTSLAYGNNALYASQVKRSRLLSIVDPYQPSNISRIALWRAGLLIFKDHPIVGVGDIDLAVLYKQYKRSFDKEIQGHMHNNFIHLLATLGIIGFLAVLFLFIKIFTIHLKNYFSLRGEPFAASYALGAAGSFIAFLVAGLTEWNFGDYEIITTIWFMLALSIAFVKNRKCTAG